MFCIWCGAPADGDVVLRCTRCERTHFLNSKIGASTLTVDGDRYLTVKRASPPEAGKWDLPGGFCEYGEDPADTAARETFEEAGLTVAVGQLLGVFMDTYLEPDGRPWPTLNLVYLASVAGAAGAAGSPLDADEIADVAWRPLAEPPLDCAFPVQLHGALDAFAARRG